MRKTSVQREWCGQPQWLSRRGWLIGIFLIAALLRVGWVAVRFADPERASILAYPDEEAYWLSATSLAAGRGLVDEFGYQATYMPAYPALLAPFTPLPQGMFWARVAQAILGSLVAPATFLLAERWLRLGKRTGSWRSSGSPPHPEQCERPLQGRRLEGHSVPRPSAWADGTSLSGSKLQADESESSATKTQAGESEPSDSNTLIAENKPSDSKTPVGKSKPLASKTQVDERRPSSSEIRPIQASPSSLEAASVETGYSSLEAELAEAGSSISMAHDDERKMSVPVLAGLAAACDPFLVFFTGLLLTEALFAAVLAGVWWVTVCCCRDGSQDSAVRGRLGLWRMVGLGLLVCLAIMLRPAATLLFGVVPLAVFIGRRFDRQAFVIAGVTVAVAMIGLLPWATRNRATVGAWVWTTTRGGISLYDGVQQGATGGSDLAHTKTMPEVADLSELEWDAHFRREAWSVIRAEPDRIARLGLQKLRRTWSLTPNVEAYRRGAVAWVGAVWTAGVLFLAALGWWRYRHATRAWLVLLLPVVAFTLLHMLFVGSVRYRVPLMPMMEVAAAAGLAGILARGPAKPPEANAGERA